MARNPLTTFTVRGRGDFPMDMLRYDCCWPVSAADVGAIETTYAQQLERLPAPDSPVPTRDIKLDRYDPHHIGPTVARWRSFGWHVVETD